MKQKIEGNQRYWGLLSSPTSPTRQSFAESKSFSQLRVHRWMTHSIAQVTKEEEGDNQVNEYQRTENSSRCLFFLVSSRISIKHVLSCGSVMLMISCLVRWLTHPCVIFALVICWLHFPSSLSCCVPCISQSLATLGVCNRKQNPL